MLLTQGQQRPCARGSRGSVVCSSRRCGSHLGVLHQRTGWWVGCDTRVQRPGHRENGGAAADVSRRNTPRTVLGEEPGWRGERRGHHGQHVKGRGRAPESTRGAPLPRKFTRRNPGRAHKASGGPADTGVCAASGPLHGLQLDWVQNKAIQATGKWGNGNRATLRQIKPV